MARGCHRVKPVRRPLALPIVGVGVAATMLAGPLLLAAVPAGAVAPEVPTVPSTTAQSQVEAIGRSALVARDEAQASRGQARPPTSPSVAPEVVAEPAPPPPPAPQPDVAAAPTVTEAPPVAGELWATRDVNVRSGPTVDTDPMGSLAALDPVGVTGTTGDGWTQVVVDGRLGWVKSSYLSQTKPEPEAEPALAPGSPAEAASGSLDASCSVDPGIEQDLSGSARAVYRAACAAYGGSVSGFGGYRPGDGGDHGSGRAVDIMVSGAVGWEIARFLQARAGELGITYVIYEQQVWMAGDPAGAWEHMEDRGGATANHFDHVHVSVR